MFENDLLDALAGLADGITDFVGTSGNANDGKNNDDSDDDA
jgi:hypothetical protein